MWRIFVQLFSEFFLNYYNFIGKTSFKKRMIQDWKGIVHYLLNFLSFLDFFLKFFFLRYVLYQTVFSLHFCHRNFFIIYRLNVSLVILCSLFKIVLLMYSLSQIAFFIIKLYSKIFTKSVLNSELGIFKLASVLFLFVGLTSTIEIIFYTTFAFVLMCFSTQ